MLYSYLFLQWQNTVFYFIFFNHIASEGFIFRMYNINYQNSKEKKNKQKMDISTHMQSTSCEMPGWVKHKLESRLPGEISITSDRQMTPPLWQKAKRNKRVSWGKWKSWLKTQHSKNKNHGIQSHHFMANRSGNN